MTEIQIGGRETREVYIWCGLVHCVICRGPDYGCFRCSQKDHYNRDCSQKEMRMCFICGQQGHVKVDCPLRMDGMVLGPTPLACQLSDGRHGRTGVPKVKV